jgi:hypothetical protein
VFSGHGATAERHRATVPAGTPPPAFPDLIWSVQIESNGQD